MDVRDRECHGGSMSTIGVSAERAGWAGESTVPPVVVVPVDRHAGDAEHRAPSVARAAVRDECGGAV